MDKDSKILVLGSNGLVGSNLVNYLEEQKYTNIIKVNRKVCDLTQINQVHELFSEKKPEYVFLAAAKVGGIMANDNMSAEMIHDNLLIQNNIIHECHLQNVKKLLFLGSSCIYPKLAKQPIKEEYLLTGALEQTNIGYSIAKIAGLTMCEMYRKQYGDDFISVMPTNLYGPGDNFNLENSHVLPGLIRKFHEAKQEKKSFIELWGSGTPMREFLFIDDLSEALVFLMKEYSEKSIINIGVGKDITIEELANLVKKIVGYEGSIMWDPSKPDGTPKKLLDVTKINEIGWKAKTSLEDGIEKTYKWFLDNQNTIRK